MSCNPLCSGPRTSHVPTSLNHMPSYFIIFFLFFLVLVIYTSLWDIFITVLKYMYTTSTIFFLVMHYNFLFFMPGSLCLEACHCEFYIWGYCILFWHAIKAHGILFFGYLLFKICYGEPKAVFRANLNHW